jgi:hypothetical protein
VQTVPELPAAWVMTRGRGAAIAVVDEGVDVDQHPEFEGRVALACYAQSDARTGDTTRRSHGAKVAGLALGGGPHVIGIAPETTLLPVGVPALSTAVGDPSEADGLRWAADNGADVICCAWGPRKPTPTSGVLPAHTRAALDHCLTHGRGGKGCIVVFSAGNDGSDLALNGYASHPGVIAVGACNCHGTHPTYSGWGDALWCVFPSNDPRDPTGASMTYLTTAPVGSLLDGEAYYTTRFGFTSAATAVVAGICALIVSANPDLTSDDVRSVLRDSCERIDAESGTYDARGHSVLYGYGRPKVARAVELARELRLAAHTA